MKFVVYYIRLNIDWIPPSSCKRPGAAARIPFLLFLTFVVFDLNWPLAVRQIAFPQIIKIYLTAGFGPGFTCWMQTLRDFPWASVITPGQISLCAQLCSETGVSSDSPPLCNLYRTIIPSCLSDKPTLLPYRHTLYELSFMLSWLYKYRFLKADSNTFTVNVSNGLM